MMGGKMESTQQNKLLWHNGALQGSLLQIITDIV
jgi:hypothetical protein